MFEVVHIDCNKLQTVYDGEIYFLFYNDSKVINPWKWEPAILYKLYRRN